MILRGDNMKIKEMQKIFKSNLRAYCVNLQIVEGYSCYKDKFIVTLYDEKGINYYEKYDNYIDNSYINKDLDKIAKECIEEYEDWHIISIN